MLRFPCIPIQKSFQISKDYGFHPAVQRWVIGKRLAQDRDSLYQYGVKTHDDSAFLFVLTAKAAHLSREQEKKEKDEKVIDGNEPFFFLQFNGSRGE